MFDLNFTEQIISIKLKESLNRLGKFTARFDAQPASFSEIET